MITIQKLHKEYNNKIVLQNVSFKAKKGEITGLIGPNGSGKSTLIRILLANLTQPEQDFSIFGGLGWLVGLIEIGARNV